MRQGPGYGLADNAFEATPVLIPVGLDNPAGQHCPLRLEPLTGPLQPKLVQPAERGQISAGEARTRG